MKEIKQHSIEAICDLIVDIHTKDAIPYDLAKKVCDHILMGVGQMHGLEGRDAVESFFFKSAAQALKQKSIDLARIEEED
jgi:hypothetical protein